jgi:hypothetical protein
VVALADERVSLGDVEASLVEIVGALDVDAIPACEAPALWKVFDRIERLAAGAKTLLAAKVEESGNWKHEGYRSPAEQLARTSGTSMTAARQTLEASKQLTALPATSDAVRRGELSAAQTGAIAGAATADPDAEERLLELAGKTNANELRDECHRTRRAADPDPDATHRRIHERRSLRTFTDAEGAWNCHVRGTVDLGARFESLLEPFIDADFERARKENRQEAREAYAYDALMKMAEGTTDSSVSRKRNTNPRYLALIRADLAALVRGAVHDDEICEIAGFGPVPVSVVRDMLGDAILKLVLTKGVDVANVVHLGRGPTAAQRIALLWSSPKCSNEACSGTFTQIDHRTPWVASKQTVLAQLDPLCTHDHRLKTHQGWSLVDGVGRRAFVPPDDPRHPRNRPPP